VGPRAGLDRRGKSRPPPGFDPQTVQPVASRYTDYAARPMMTVGNDILWGVMSIGSRTVWEAISIRNGSVLVAVSR